MARFTNNLLKPRNTLAVTLDRPKTAALAFNRVYAPNDLGVPGEITPGFVWLQKDMLIHAKMTRSDGTPDPNALIAGITRPTLNQHLKTDKDALFGALAREGYRPIEFLDNLEQTYSAGKDRYIFAVLDGYVEIEETNLNWEQVIEFRKDAEAFLAYQALVGWFDKECKEMERRQAEQHVFQTYENGRAALLKHGIVPSYGTVGTLLTAAIVPWFSPLSFWGAGIASTLSGLGVAAKLWEGHLQKKETKRLNAPLAYIQKLQTLPSISAALAAEHREALAAGRDMLPES